LENINLRTSQGNSENSTGKRKRVGNESKVKALASKKN